MRTRKRFFQLVEYVSPRGNRKLPSEHVIHVGERRWNLSEEQVTSVWFNRHKVWRPLCMEKYDERALVKQVKDPWTSGLTDYADRGRVDRSTLFVTFGLCEKCLRTLGLEEEYDGRRSGERRE